MNKKSNALAVETYAQDQATQLSHEELNDVSGILTIGLPTYLEMKSETPGAYTADYMMEIGLSAYKPFLRQYMDLSSAASVVNRWLGIAVASQIIDIKKKRGIKVVYADIFHEFDIDMGEGYKMKRRGEVLQAYARHRMLHLGREGESDLVYVHQTLFESFRLFRQIFNLSYAIDRIHNTGILYKLLENPMIYYHGKRQPYSTYSTKEARAIVSMLRKNQHSWSVLTGQEPAPPAQESERADNRKRGLVELMFERKHLEDSLFKNTKEIDNRLKSDGIKKKHLPQFKDVVESTVNTIHNLTLKGVMWKKHLK